MGCMIISRENYLNSEARDFTTAIRNFCSNMFDNVIEQVRKADGEPDAWRAKFLRNTY